MKGKFRQSMTWLHTWGSLVMGWILFIIFIMGTAAFFRSEITHWMTPEVHSSVPNDDSVLTAYAWLAKMSPESEEWNINLPDPRSRTLQVSWPKIAVKAEQAPNDRRNMAEPEQRSRPQESGMGVSEQRGRQQGNGMADPEQRGRQQNSAMAGSEQRGRPQGGGMAALSEQGQVDVVMPAPVQGRNRRQMERYVLDATTGEILDGRETRGGGFLLRFHYELYGMPRTVAFFLVGIATMLMLVGIISGIIIHKKIFLDFFSFRPGKRSSAWLDAHVSTSVLSLPFHLMITFSGLLLLSSTLLFWNSDRGFGGGGGGGRGAATEEIVPVLKAHALPDGFIMPPLKEMIDQAEQHWGGEVGQVNVSKPMQEDMTFSLSPQSRGTISTGRGGQMSLVFDSSGEQVEEINTTPNNSAIAATYNTLSTLHQGRFAGVFTRWLLFFSGVLGTVMVATGLVLWTVKRAKQQLGSFGYEMVSALNIASVAGLTSAIAVYFWANRLIPGDMQGREVYEVNAFLIAWLVLALYAVLSRHNNGWIIQLSIGGILYAAIPILDASTSSTGLVVAWSALDWLRIGFDLTCLLTGCALLWAAYKLYKKQAADALKVLKKGKAAVKQKVVKTREAQA